MVYVELLQSCEMSLFSEQQHTSVLELFEVSYPATFGVSLGNEQRSQMCEDCDCDFRGGGPERSGLCVFEGTLKERMR